MVLTHWLMRARTLESVIARAPAIAAVRRLGAARLRHHHCPGGRQCLHLFPVLTPSAGWLRVRLANALLAGRRCTIATRGRPRPTVPELRSRCRCGRCPSSPGAGSSSARWCCWHCCSPGGKRTGVASVSRPASSNTFGLWAIQRRRIDAGEGDATVLLGASRVFFDLQLPVWERLGGKRPIQLSFEGTSPLPALEDLAADPQIHRAPARRSGTGPVLLGL